MIFEESFGAEAAPARRNLQRAADPRVEIESIRHLEVVKTVIKLLDVPIREVERRTGFSHSYWNNVLAGKIKLRMENVVALAYALELQPAEMFHLLYPVRTGRSSKAALHLQGLAQCFGGNLEGAIVEESILHLSGTQARRWAHCADLCGYGSIEEWLIAAAEAEILRQRALSSPAERV